MRLHTRQMTLMGLMTAVICVIAPFSINIPISPVPISLCTLAIYFAVMVLGMKCGTISVLLYLLLGLAGIPVFSNFSGGVGKLLGPTGGYLWGYLFLAIICGFSVDRWYKRRILCFCGMAAGTAVCYLFGTAWLSYQASISFTQALFSAVVPFLPGDAAKLVLAMVVGRQIRTRLTKANLFRQ